MFLALILLCSSGLWLVAKSQHSCCVFLYVNLECGFLQELSAAEITIAAIDHEGDQNPVDVIWGSKRPAPPQFPVRIHKMAYAGEAVQDKLAKVTVSGDLNALTFGREFECHDIGLAVARP